MYSLGLFQQTALAGRQGRCRGSACLQTPLSVESCVIGNLLDGCRITWHYGDSLGSPVAVCTVGLGNPVLSQNLTGPLWDKPLALQISAAWITQSRGWGGGFRCAQRTHVQVTGVSPVNTAAQAQKGTDSSRTAQHRGPHSVPGEITLSQPHHDGLHAHGTLCA